MSAERLVQVYRARDDWQGTLLTGFLNDQGVRATLRLPPSVPPFDWYEFFAHNNSIDGVFVFEHDVTCARQLIGEFLGAEPDEAALEQQAAHKPHPDRDKIHWLRIALIEERQTFKFLGLLALSFLSAGFLYIGLPSLRVAALLGFTLVAVMAGNWLRGKL